MKLLSKKNFFLLAGIIFLDSSGIHILKLSARILIKRLNRKTGVFFSVHEVKIKKSRRLHCSSIYIRNSRFKIIIKSCEISFWFRYLLDKRAIYKSIRYFNFHDAFILCSFSDSIKKEKETLLEAQKLHFEEKCYPVFRDVINRLWTWNIKGCAGVIEVLVFFYDERFTLLLNELIIGNNSFSAIAEIKLKNCIVKTPFQILKGADFGSFEINNQNMLQGITVMNADRLLFSIAEYKILYKEADAYNYSLVADINDTYISSRYVSSHPLKIRKIEFEQLIQFSEVAFSILKESSLCMDGVAGAFEFHHCVSESDLIKMSVILLIEGNTFFTGFPFLFLKEIRTINASGNMVLKLDYMTSLTDLASYYFDFKILQNTLHIEAANGFVKKHFLSDQMVQTIDSIASSPGNKYSMNYAFYKEMPKYLIDIIIAAEDPNFYIHTGVDAYYIGIAIAKNIVNKKYVKGASTITMQLARNLFLTHEKNLSRKFEEIILALLIESYFDISKDKIFEMYLNVIEFGEAVYGICDASDFYFNKQVADLNITECLVLSYIIPRPKYFLEAVLIKSRNLIDNLIKHMEYYSNALLNKGLISNQCFMSITYTVRFKSSIGILVLKE